MAYRGGLSLSFNRKSKVSVQTPAEQFAAIVATAAGFDAAEAERERQKLLTLYIDECVEGRRCLDDSAAEALPGLRQCAERLGISSAFLQPNIGKLNDAIGQYVAAEYMHYRALRARIWHLEHEALYAIHLARLGFSACAAVAAGAHHEALWLSRAYVRHVHAGYEDDYSVDLEFIDLCHWLLSWYLTGDPRAQNCPEGMYSALAHALDDVEPLQRATESVLDTRTDHAFRQFVLEEDVEPRFYRQLFSASFPFEVLAFRALVERHRNVRFELQHPAVSHLMSMRMPDTHALSVFEPRVESRLAEIEAELGLEVSGV
jgi:hypothetical protein